MRSAIYRGAQSEISHLPHALSALRLPPLFHPRQKSAQSFSLAPTEPKKFRRSKRVHVPAEKCFETPPKIRAGPRAQPVSLGCNPVIAQRGEYHRLVPPLAFAQRSNLRNVVASVPRVVVHEIVDRHHPIDGMPQPAREIIGVQRAKQTVPTKMQKLEQ